MADVISSIVSYLRSRALPDKIIAAILGNMQQESGFSTSAANSGEGAIGLIQWEGGRRRALQDFARSRGTSETDLRTQLDFMYNELSQAPYNGILSEMNAAPSAGAAAAIWDEKYEVSSGSSRGQRQANAEHFASNGLTSAGVSINPGGGNTTMGASAVPLSAPTMSPADKKKALIAGMGPLGVLLTQVPELAALLNTAISTGQSGPDFLNAVQNSPWYRTHSSSVRDAMILQASDPKTYLQNVTNANGHVLQMAQQMGVTLTHAQLVALGYQYMTAGWDTPTLQHNIGAYYNKAGTPQGQAAAIYQQLQQMYESYGQTVGAASLQFRTQQILGNNTTLDTYKQGAIKTALATYPGATESINSGLTVNDIAQPYKAAMANILELDQNSIGTNDRLIKQAMQGTHTPDGKPPVTVPIWQFENTLRQDPRWDKTNNARHDAAAVVTQLGKAWGYEA